MEQIDEGGGREIGEEEGGKKLGKEGEGEVPGRGGLVRVMDTPDRTRIATPLAKFEESPVFNYINNLSPLEMVKPVRISQTFNSYSFSSLPSVFSSPHVSSLKGTRFLRRHAVSDPSSQEFFLENDKRACNEEGVVDVAHQSKEQKENFDPGGCIGKASNELKHENEAPRVQEHDYQGPENNTVACHVIAEKSASSDLVGTSSSLVNFAKGEPSSGLACNNELNSEDGTFDWAPMSDVAEFLIFESPINAEPLKGSFQQSVDLEMRTHISQKTKADGLVGAKINEKENTSIDTGKVPLDEMETAKDVLAVTCNDKAIEETNDVIENESACNLPRGMRRRCLVFEMGGARRKFFDEGPSSSSSMSSKCDITSDDKQPVPSKLDNNSSRCIVPGIGLHLNALARTSKEYTPNNHESLTCQGNLINDPNSNAVLEPVATNQETMDGGPAEGGFHVAEDAHQTSGYMACDEFNQGSPKRKKRRLENGGEAESCKRCNCKKSKCLKLYCECFAAGVYCVEPCSCQDCFNKPIHEDTVLATRKQIESRNPLAFAPKVIRNTDFAPETGDDTSSTPASARHKRGCNCKKSGCLKKYCECYQGGVGCSINCRCEGCKNAFGRKDGSVIIVAEAEEESETHEKSIVDRSLSKNIIQNSTEQNPDSAPPATPMHYGRASVPLPFSSKNKTSRSFLSIGSSSSALYGGQKFGIPAFMQPQPKFQKQDIRTNQGDEIPEILRGNCSPTGKVKSSSPNNKRVSPPHCDLESSSSPARRTSRKLILQSIPSFPSLKD